MPRIVLDYAEAPRSKRQRVYLQRLAIVAAIAIAVWFLVKLRPWEELRDAYYRHQCATYTAPADQIVYEEDPTVFAALLKSAPEYRQLQGGVARLATPWEKLTYGTRRAGIVLLHERKAVQSAPAVLALEAPWPSMVSGQVGQFMEFRYVIHSGNEPPRRGGVGGVRIWIARSPTFSEKDRVPFRLFAGQPDPTDLSHFTIGYEEPRGRGIVDGWMEGNNVRLEVRDGPWAVKPATTQAQ
jgi:hypothetical protein